MHRSLTRVAILILLCLGQPALAAGHSEKALFMTVVSDDQVQEVVLGKTFARATYRSEEAGADAVVTVLAKAPAWKVMFYAEKSKKQFSFPLAKVDSVNTNYMRIRPSRSKLEDAGKWQGLAVQKTRVEAQSGGDTDSIMAFMCPTSKSKEEQTHLYEYYFTDSIKLSHEQEEFLKLVYSESSEIAIFGLPLGLKRYQNTTLRSWSFRVSKLEEKQVDPDSFKYPVGFQQCASIDAVCFDKNQMSEIESIGDSMEIGKPLGKKSPQQK